MTNIYNNKSFIMCFDVKVALIKLKVEVKKF